MFSCKDCGREFKKAVTAQGGTAGKLAPGQLGHYCQGAKASTAQPTAVTKYTDGGPQFIERLTALISVGNAILAAHQASLTPTPVKAKGKAKGKTTR